MARPVLFLISRSPPDDQPRLSPPPFMPSGLVSQHQRLASQDGDDGPHQDGGASFPLSQEAAGQLSQATLSLSQLTQGSNRLQACRCVGGTGVTPDPEGMPTLKEPVLNG